MYDVHLDRAALKVYEESVGKVLLLAVVEGLTDAMDDSWVGGGGGGNNSGRRTPAEIAAIRGSARGIRQPTEAEEEGVAGDRGSAAAFVHATIFPGGGLIFAGKCNVLVLGEDKTQAERLLMQLQVVPVGAGVKACQGYKQKRSGRNNARP